MNATAGLPLPSLSRGRFAYAFGSSFLQDSARVSMTLGGTFVADEGGSGVSDESLCMAWSDGASHGFITAFTDQALFEACGVRVAFTERSGGCSAAPFDSLNLKFGLGDNRGAVERNQAALTSAFGATGFPLVVPNQVHGTSIVQVASVREYEAAHAAAEQGCDAVVVGMPDTPVLLCFADCLPLALVAPGGQFAVVHCGWRGTVAHLAAKAFECLVALAGCAPGEVNAYIGPYIHAECFEVSGEVAERFVDAFGQGVVSVTDAVDMDGPGVGDSDADVPGRLWHVNLGAAVCTDLERCGCAPGRIADVGICTACNTDRFFSYRTSGGVTGRHGAFAFRVG